MESKDKITISRSQWMEIHKKIMRDNEAMMDKLDREAGVTPDPTARMGASMVVLKTLLDTETELFKTE